MVNSSTPSSGRSDHPSGEDRQTQHRRVIDHPSGRIAAARAGGESASATIPAADAMVTILAPPRRRLPRTKDVAYAATGRVLGRALSRTRAGDRRTRGRRPNSGPPPQRGPAGRSGWQVRDSNPRRQCRLIYRQPEYLPSILRPAPPAPFVLVRGLAPPAYPRPFPIHRQQRAHTDVHTKGPTGASEAVKR
jgi:hypothetical protein